MSQHKNTSLINPFTLATVEPMQRVYMDTIGPINSDSQVIEANDNYNYVLVVKLYLEALLITTFILSLIQSIIQLNFNIHQKFSIC